MADATTVNAVALNSVAPTTAASDFPGPTVARLTKVHALLQQLRDGISDGIDKVPLRLIVDQIFPEIFTAITEIQTGPSLMDQFTAKFGLDLQQQKIDADLEMIQQRERAIAQGDAANTAFVSAIFKPLGPGTT